MAMAFQNVYDITPLSKAQPKLAFLPVTVDCSVKTDPVESDLEAYPGMFVQSQQGKYGLKGVFAPYPAKTDSLSLTEAGICNRNHRFYIP